MSGPILPLRLGTLDLGRRVLTRPEGPVLLTTKEAELLTYLAARPDQPVSRDELLREVWGYRSPVETRTLDVTIRRLRAKVEHDPAHPDHVLTQHGEGYRFHPAAVATPAPAGEVTLVFTDIEGSTALWERHGAAFQGSLDVHDRVVRGALARHGGYEVKTVGDAFVVAFADPGNAVRFCLDAQAALAAASFPHGPVRVRMGAHVGVPIERADPVTGRRDWFGPVVNRAARVSGMAHGGQIVVTDEVRRRAEATWTPLGAHPADGLEAPLVVWQADPLGAPVSRFPPLRSRAGTPLPTPVDSFVGRSAELADLARRHREGARLLSIVGPGGTGKTRLALEAARRWPQGRALFVELAEVSDAGGLRVATARALAQPGAGESVEQLGRALAERGGILLVLDNAEHLVREVGDAVRAWLDAAPIVILVTTRVPLRLPGEQRLDLGPLEVAEATELFAARARARHSTFAADPGEVAALVTALDGWPLAIELAASRVATWPVPVLRRRLAERFRLLVDGVGPERQRSLQTVLDDAWETLDADGRRGLSELAVFAGGFPVAEVEAVLTAADPWAAVDRLVDLALARVDGATGRGELPASIREYGLSRLSPEERDAAERRHAAWLLALPEDVTRLAPEVENLLVATRRALARRDAVANELALRLATVAERRGPYAAAAALCDEVGRATPDGRLTVAAAELYRNAGDSPAALRLLQGDPALFEDPRVGARARAAAAACLYNLGRRDEAWDLAGTVPPGGPAGVWASTVRAVIDAKRGAGGTVERIAAAMAEADRVGEVECGVILRVARMRAALLAGDPAEAKRWIDAARAQAARHGHESAAELAEVWAGLALLQRGRAEEAVPHLHRALERCVASGRLTFRSTYAANLGIAELLSGDEVAAVGHLRDALRWDGRAFDDADRVVCIADPRQPVGAEIARRARLVEAVEAAFVAVPRQ